MVLICLEAFSYEVQDKNAIHVLLKARSLSIKITCIMRVVQYMLDVKKGLSCFLWFYGMRVKKVYEALKKQNFESL